MCKELIINDTIAPQSHHYTTLQNTNVRHLATIWNECLVN